MSNPDASREVQSLFIIDWIQGRKTVLVILVTQLVWARAYWIKATLGITG